MSEPRWKRIVGDGLICRGPCLVHDILFTPNAVNDTVSIYDGRDATTGRLFATLFTAVKVSWAFCLADGVRFDRGIYIDSLDGDQETTIVFTPLSS